MGKVNATQNPDCDHLHCKDPDGEVRALPLGGDANIILCETCYKREIKARKEFNKETGEKLWDLPKWSELDVVAIS